MIQILIIIVIAYLVLKHAPHLPFEIGKIFGKAVVQIKTGYEHAKEEKDKNDECDCDD